MKYAITNNSNPNAMQLQSIGWVLGTPAAEVKVGDVLMWNFGSTSKIDEVIKETPKSLVVVTNKDGKRYERRMMKTRLVCILQP